MFLLTLFAIVALSDAASTRIREPIASHTTNTEIEPIPVDPFFAFNEDPDAFIDAALPKKKTEKLPLQKKVRSLTNIRPIPEQLPVVDSDRPIPDVLPGEFSAQPGVAPKLTGSSASSLSTDAPGDFDYFNFGEGAGAVTNPAATYLAGGQFEKIATPNCRMVGCVGPLPNDGTFISEAPSQQGKACHQTFVPMNGCTDGKGYPVGMLCSICCDCSAPFVREMKKTHGFKIGYTAN
ncbi:unnamed protein product [Nippostrongylus brasiliensis]|uniref:Uncharacterized protein n=1 Tax=Nippostrongylus brasiliensis TaxID=27835 RepID=A0A0N4XUR7_NIPBR|nr:unnamed protein product [Nippostrongylus brasiliensis]